MAEVCVAQRLCTWCFPALPVAPSVSAQSERRPAQAREGQPGAVPVSSFAEGYLANSASTGLPTC